MAWLVRIATTRSDERFETVSTPEPFAVTSAPALASAVIASAGAGVRSVMRLPEAAAMRSATEVSAVTRPRPMTTRWPAVPSSSPIRWLDTKDRAVLRGERAQEVLHPDDALGVHAVVRLVEDQHWRVAQQRRGDAQPLPHAEGVAAG